MKFGNGGQPLAPEQVLEQGPCECSLALVQVLAVVGVGHTFACLERSEQCVDRADGRQDGAPQRSDVVEARDVQERLFMTGRNGEPALVPIRVRLDLQEIAGRLVLEPLARVPLVDAGSSC